MYINIKRVVVFYLFFFLRYHLKRFYIIPDDRKGIKNSTVKKIQPSNMKGKTGRRIFQ